MHEYQGTWWRPENPDHVVAGTLRIANGGGMSLLLIGGFETRTFTPSGPGTYTVSQTGGPIDVVLGTVDPKESITLIDCHVDSARYSFSDEILSQQLSPSRALVGVHQGDVSANDFTQATIELEGFHTWASLRDVEWSGASNEGRRQRSVSVTQAEPIEFCAGGWSFTIRHRVDHFGVQNYRDHDEVVSAQRTFIDIASDKPLPHDGFDSVVSALADLVTFASQTASAVSSYSLRHRVPERRRRPVLGRQSRPDGQLELEEYDYPVTARVFRPWITHPSVDGKSESTGRYLFTAADIDLAEVVTRWLELRVSVQRGIDMLLSLRYGEATFIQTEVLVLAVAAEAFHRGLYPDCLRMFPEQFEQIRDAALAGLDESDRTMYDVIRNEPTYRERLTDLATLPSNLDPQAAAAILPDVAEWAGKLTAIRNGLAHALTRSRAGEDIELLLDLRRRTEDFFGVLLLSELGLSGTVQRRAALENGYYADALLHD